MPGFRSLYTSWFTDVVSTGDVERADVLLAPGYVLHLPGMPPVDADGHKRLVVGFRTGFPDGQETVDHVVAEGDRAVVAVTGRGTHEGPFQGLPATGTSVEITGVGIGRIEGGRMAEAWAHSTRSG